MIDEDAEYWKDIRGYEGYEISTHGRVISYRNKGGSIDYDKPHFMRLSMNQDGYYQLRLIQNKLRPTWRIHKLMAFVFYEESNLEVDHIDGNKSNNHINNLRLVTRSQNMLNISKHKNNTLGLKGIRPTNYGYRFEIQLDKKRHTKRFKTIEDAIKYRNRYIEQHPVLKQFYRLE